MGSSWSGFQPQNEIVKLQWAALEISEFRITAQEFELLLSIAGLSRRKVKEESEAGEGPAFPLDS